jgi:hypothetical protein
MIFRVLARSSVSPGMASFLAYSTRHAQEAGHFIRQAPAQYDQH